MMKTFILLFVILFCAHTAVLAEDSKSKPELEKTESPYSKGEIAFEVGMGIASAAAGGVHWHQGTFQVQLLA